MVWVVGYALIGFVTGLLSKKLMPGKVAAGPIALFASLGVLGAIFGGVSCLRLLRYGRAQLYLDGYISVNSGENGGTVPAYWISLFTAMTGALLVLAVYKLIKGKRSHI